MFLFVRVQLIDNQRVMYLQDKLDHRSNYRLTKREMFAMAAMQGIMANRACLPTETQHFENIAEDAITAADELLKQLEK